MTTVPPPRRFVRPALQLFPADSGLLILPTTHERGHAYPGGHLAEPCPPPWATSSRTKIPGARLVKLSGYGRALLTEKPLETAALMGDYITGNRLPFGEAKPLRLKSIVADTKTK